mgnify:CR=1 FL=1
MGGWVRVCVCVCMCVRVCVCEREMGARLGGSLACVHSACPPRLSPFLNPNKIGFTRRLSSLPQPHYCSLLRLLNCSWI